MHIEIITRKGREFAVIPMSTFRKIMVDSEMLANVRVFDAAKARLEQDGEEIIPFDVVERRVKGEPPVKIWREYRGITQEKLAKASGVSRTMIAAIESGHKKGAVGTLKKLAAALDVSLDQLV